MREENPTQVGLRKIVEQQCAFVNRPSIAVQLSGCLLHTENPDIPCSVSRVSAHLETCQCARVDKLDSLTSGLNLDDGLPR